MRQRENGILVGTVIDINDPENLGRVKAQLKQYGDVESHWARLAVPMAGGDRGLFLRPEVGDEVLMAFANGEPREPYVLGSLWSRVDKPPPGGVEDQKNNVRYFVSRSGSTVRFDDTESAEKIEVIDKSGKLKVLIDTAGKKIAITCDAGSIEMSAGSIKLEAKTVEIKSSAETSIEATGAMKIKGATVDIN